RRKFGIVIVAAADRRRPISGIQLLLPERDSGVGTFLCSSIHGFDGGNQPHLRSFRMPPAAHARLSGGRAGMIDRKERATRADPLEQSFHIGNRTGANTEIHEASSTVKIGVTLKGRNLSARNQ